MKSICFTSFILLFSLVGFSCTTVRLVNQGNITCPIEMETYRIALPDLEPWKEWAVTQTPMNETVSFQRLKIHPLNGVILGRTEILIFKTEFLPVENGISETELAKALIDKEERIMRGAGETTDGYELRDVKKAVVELNGKKLHTMTYRVTRGSATMASFKRCYFVKAAYYLYFPDDFQDSHNVYRFLIQESYIPGAFVSVDLEKIHPIINAFRLIPPEDNGQS
ncbi:hypothetical protein [Desulfoluna spongiiphila]|uniref:Lipoprotein n=1 Tax=Desulfoluna spongiiphila TaxID=419481 RepID=A0A1G5BMK7_9BACT|nr:hypothetical protein [Desulfoluna spongiiphila]SCX91415.1 hypothetical protein SAMN05216233_102100 [Desulfoluna spongiiphila]VVS93819.1 prokaryotic membrane lipoprotein lipid attachment site profile [Desulfoluna spongiiphila]